MSRAVFPGTFDPITRGHEALARRAAAVFDELVVGVAAGIHKRAFFSLEERVALARESFAGEGRIRPTSFDGLLADFMRREDCCVIIRGVRVVSDFEFESQLADINRALDGRLETIFFLPNREYIYLSSTMVREVAQLGGDVGAFVSPHVACELTRKYDGRGGVD